MNYFDNEEVIIDFFRSTALKREVIYPLRTLGAMRAFNSIFSPHKWKLWHSSNGKDDPPPDFYSDKLKIMMEVMRVDDHSRVDESQKWSNPTNKRESQLQKELKENGFLDAFPNVRGIFVNAITDLPTNEDHNYKFYYSGFQHTLKKHINKISLYRKNHPGCKLIFFVFDESSGYVQADDKNLVVRGVKPGEAFGYHPYLHFLDKRFVDIFKNEDIDYLIWYSPFKHFESENPLRIPTVCVYDVKRYNYKHVREFPEEYILSTEC